MNYPGCDVFVDSRLEYAATWQSAAANSRLSHRNFIDRSAIIRCYDPIGIASPRNPFRRIASSNALISAESRRTSRCSAVLFEIFPMFGARDWNDVVALL
jgi:hypothetical protein